MKNTVKVLIIIPAYNEEKCIVDTYNSIKKCKDYKYDALVINDGSKDNTEKVLQENNIPHIKLIRNLGIGGAVQTGYKYAYENDYDIAIQCDGDGQHDINYAKYLVDELINENCDMCIGSRFINKEEKGFKSSRKRRIGINIISSIIKFLTNEKIYDTTSGFRAVNKDIIKIFKDDYPYEYPEPVSSVSIIKRGYKIKEVPVVMKERTTGTSSIKAWKEAYYMINVSIAMFIESIKR